MTTVAATGARPTIDIQQAAGDLRAAAAAAGQLVQPGAAQAKEAAHPGPVLAKPETRFVRKTDRYDPRSEQKEVVRLQMRISEVMAGINAYTSAYRAAANKETVSATDFITKSERLDSDLRINEEESASLRTFVSELNIRRIDPESEQEVKAELDIKKIEEGSYEEVKAQSDLLRQTIKTIQGRFVKFGKDPKHNAERAQLNLIAIKAYEALIRTQIKLTNLTFNTSTTSPLCTCQTGLMLLKNADNNADLLSRELNWRKNRAETSDKIKKTQALDFVGDIIWATKPENLDIRMADGTTTIRQQVWITPYRRIGSIIKDLKDTNFAKAKEKIQDCIGLYDTNGLANKAASSDEIVKQLQALDQYIQDHSGNICEDNHIQEVKAKIKNLRELISEDESHPVQKDINYSKDAAAGLRSRIHILEGNHEDFITVAKALAHIEDLSLLLSMAAKKQWLSRINKKIIDDDLASLIEWTSRGHVYPKQFATKFLEHIPGIIENGFSSQKGDPAQAAKHYRSAAAELKKAASELLPRLGALVRISGGSKNKLDAIYTELKDADIQGRASRIVSLFKEKKYTEALEQVQTMKSQYFTFLFPEPGYKRASAGLNEIEKCIRDGATNHSPELENKVKHLADLVVADIEHKHQLRLIVADFDEEQPFKKYVFPSPNRDGGISPYALTAWLKRGTGWLRQGQKWVALKDLRRTSEFQDLHDKTILLASNPPTTMKAIEKGLPRLIK